MISDARSLAAVSTDTVPGDLNAKAQRRKDAREPDVNPLRMLASIWRNAAAGLSDTAAVRQITAPPRLSGLCAFTSWLKNLGFFPRARAKTPPIVDSPTRVHPLL